MLKNKKTPNGDFAGKVLDFPGLTSFDFRLFRISDFEFAV